MVATERSLATPGLCHQRRMGRLGVCTTLEVAKRWPARSQRLGDAGALVRDRRQASPSGSGSGSGAEWPCWLGVVGGDSIRVLLLVAAPASPGHGEHEAVKDSRCAGRHYCQRHESFQPPTSAAMSGCRPKTAQIGAAIAVAFSRSRVGERNASPKSRWGSA
jgi:hypothetical protein